MSAEIDQELYDRVVSLVAKVTNHRKDKIKPESRFFHDLGVDGIDGEDLLAAFHDEFNIDCCDFVFDRHFGPEWPFNPFMWL